MMKHFESQAANDKQKLEEKKRIAKEKQDIAKNKQALMTINLLLQRNPNCPIAAQLLDEHAKEALRCAQAANNACEISSTVDNEGNVNN